LVIDDAVKPSTHINAVGSDRPDRHEVDDELMGRAGCRRRLGSCSDSGDLVRAVAAGTMWWEDVIGDLVALARGSVQR
jgi:ornithine cyclodeaminase/alanine dehydrogenase-like protein (mu-crystallin family)